MSYVSRFGTLCFGFLFVVSLTASSSILDPRLTTFYIKQEEEAKHKVLWKDPVSSSEVECTFSYNTKSPPKPEEEKPKVAIRPVEEVINGILESYPPPKCFEHTSQSGWAYKVCLGESVTQSYPGSQEMKFNLGKYTGIDTSEENDVRLVFNGGDACVPEGARLTHVSFACGNIARIHQIREPKTCQYLVVMQVPEVCGHPSFPAVVSDETEDSQAGNEEGWFLEITQLIDSTIVCNVRHSGIGKIDPTFHFNSFSLQFTSGKPKDFKVRRSNREDLEDEEIEFLSGGIRSSGNFKHTLHYASISRK